MSFPLSATEKRTRSKLSWAFNFLSRIPLLLFLILAGCAHRDSVGPAPATPHAPSLPPSIFAAVPTGKSLREIPSFVVVDDFNVRHLKNRFGAPWKIESDQTGSLRFNHLWQKRGNGRLGSFLRFKASLAPSKEVVFKSSLQGLDMSRALALVLKCRLMPKRGRTFSGTIELVLSDLKDRTAREDLTPLCTAGPSGWKEVQFSRAALSPLNWEGLKEISLVFRAGAEPVKTEIGLDEIAFYGLGDLEFESQRDNLVGFPMRAKAPDRSAALLRESEDRAFLIGIARDTWKYFENAVDHRTHLPVDHIRVGDPQSVGSYTTPTNLAMYLLACVSAKELGIISKGRAVSRIQKTLETLRVMKRRNGFYYNFYHSGNLQVTRDYVSTVDSGWLAAAWVVLRQAFPKELGGLATQFLNEANFKEFYDTGMGQLKLGFDEAAGRFSPYHYGLLATEARATSFIGIGKGDLPREHWWRIFRTPPPDWDWQNQIPQGREVEIDHQTVFEGHYTYQGKKFVPSWGGSLFEFLMPSLVMKERELAPKGLGLNNRIATELHIDYALNRRGYPVWGISPAAVSSGRQWQYREFGVKYLGVKGYKDEGVVSPYVSFLALDTLPEQAIDNLRRMLQLYEVYGEYGFYDSITVRNGRVNSQYLILDQGMSLVAITNYLRKGIIQEYFHRDPVSRNAEPLLGMEEFFA